MFGFFICACVSPYVILIPEFYSAFQDCDDIAILCVSAHICMCYCVNESETGRYFHAFYAVLRDTQD